MRKFQKVTNLTKKCEVKAVIKNEVLCMCILQKEEKKPQKFLKHTAKLQLFKEESFLSSVCSFFRKRDFAFFRSDLSFFWKKIRKR